MLGHEYPARLGLLCVALAPSGGQGQISSEPQEQTDIVLGEKRVWKGSSLTPHTQHLC